MLAVLVNPHGRPNQARKSMLDLSGSGWEVTAMTVEGKSLSVRFFNAAGDNRAQGLSLDGHAGKVTLMELNGDMREILHPIATSDGRTTVELSIPRFGVRTVKFDNHSL